jgi:succinoglycan biosynthesis protein ExoW
MGASDKIAVIIPFYQRTRGLLIKAVESVFRQQDASDVRIIVVDDGSPVKAREELAGLVAHAGNQLTVIEQSNQGCPGATNTGLQNVPPGTDFVAFLDSDDEWTSEHLSNAGFAMRQGFDLYFSDFYQLNQTVTAFKRARRIDIADHPLLPGSNHVREYCGDMVNQIITGNILGTSVTVFSYEKLKGLRLREDFRHTGMEYLFWLDFALRAKRIAFSDLPECRYGAGVNIYSESAWGQEKFLTVILDEIKYRQTILRHYPITNAQRAFIKGRINGLRRDFTACLIHRSLASKRFGDGAILGEFLKLDPTYPLTIWPATLRLTLEKLLHRARNSATPAA